MKLILKKDLYFPDTAASSSGGPLFPWKVWRGVSPCWLYPSSWPSLPARLLDIETSWVSCGYLLTRNDLYFLNRVAQRVLCERLLRMLEANKQKNCPEKCLIVLSSRCMRNTSPVLSNWHLITKLSFDFWFGGVVEFRALLLRKHPHETTIFILFELGRLG